MKQVIALSVLLTVCPVLGQLSCSGDLASKLNKDLSVNDPDGDGVVTGQELHDELNANYDKDNDGCISEDEWVARWTSFYGFTKEFAVARLDNLGDITNVACPIAADDLLNSSTPVFRFLGDNLNTLKDMCNNDSSLASTNCDCVQLAAVCNLTDDACQNFVEVVQFGDKCDGKGFLARRINMQTKINDANGDGNVTGPEFFNDFSNNYDVNKDGCCSVQEWTDRWESYFKFSKAYAIQRLTDIVPDMSAACTVQYGFYQNDTKTSIPDDVFEQNMLESLVKMCRASPDLVRTNCDCAQLLRACKLDPHLSKNVICTNYAANPVV